MRASLICNVLALLGFAWLVWMNFFAPRPTLGKVPSGVDAYAVSAPLHAGVPFIVPACLLLAGIVLQILSSAGAAK